MTRKDTRKRKGDRHKPGYMTAYMRTWRAKQKPFHSLSRNEETSAVRPDQTGDEK